MKECGAAIRRAVLVAPDDSAKAEADIIARLPVEVAASLIETLVAQDFRRDRQRASQGWIDLRGHQCSDALRKAVEEVGGALAVLPRFAAPSNGEPAAEALEPVGNICDRAQETASVVADEALPATDASAVPAPAPAETPAAIADDIQTVAADASALKSSRENGVNAQQVSAEPTQPIDCASTSSVMVADCADASPATENAKTEPTQRDPEANVVVALSGVDTSAVVKPSEAMLPTEVAIGPSVKPTPNPSATSSRRFGRTVTKYDASPNEPVPEIIPDFLKDIHVASSGRSAGTSSSHLKNDPDPMEVSPSPATAPPDAPTASKPA
jgi:hypothetical protein